MSAKVNKDTGFEGWGLSVHTQNILRRAGVYTLKELCESRNYLAKFRGMGEQSFMEIYYRIFNPDYIPSKDGIHSLFLAQVRGDCNVDVSNPVLQEYMIEIEEEQTQQKIQELQDSIEKLQRHLDDLAVKKAEIQNKKDELVWNKSKPEVPVFINGRTVYTKGIEAVLAQADLADKKRKIEKEIGIKTSKQKD